jgi:hypothetical protein
MPRNDETFVDRFLEPWNRHDVDGDVWFGSFASKLPCPLSRPLSPGSDMPASAIRRGLRSPRHERSIRLME